MGLLGKVSKINLEFSKLRMTHCFDLWRLKIRGVTFNGSSFWSMEVERGGHKYETFLFKFWMVEGKLIILRGPFFTLPKLIIYMEWPPPTPIGKFHKNNFFWETFPHMNNILGKNF